MVRLSLAGLALAASLSAATITSDSLSLSFYSNGVSTGPYTSVGPGVSSGAATVDSWTGNASLVTNIVGGSFNFPLSLALTGLSFTCGSATCPSLEIDFSGQFFLAGDNPEIHGAAPYQVSLSGTGPGVTLDYTIDVSDGYGVSGSSVYDSGPSYTFNDSGYLGIPRNLTATDGSEVVTIFGSLITDNGLPSGTTITLPDSFVTNVGPQSGVPEPGTLLSGASALALGLVAFARRRRSAAR